MGCCVRIAWALKVRAGGSCPKPPMPCPKDEPSCSAIERIAKQTQDATKINEFFCNDAKSPFRNLLQRGESLFPQRQIGILAIVLAMLANPFFLVDELVCIIHSGYQRCMSARGRCVRVASYELNFTTSILRSGRHACTSCISNFIFWIRLEFRFSSR